MGTRISNASSNHGILPMYIDYMNAIQQICFSYEEVTSGRFETAVTQFVTLKHKYWFGEEKNEQIFDIWSLESMMPSCF